jgi:hypothetical protein
MSIREQINNNPTLFGTIMTLAIAGAAGLIWWQASSGGRPTYPNAVYYYDLNTGQLFTGPRNPGQAANGDQQASGDPSMGQIQADMRTERIEAPCGPTDDGQLAGVRARVYACGSCPSSLLGKTYEEVAQTEAALSHLESGMQVSEPGDIEWLPANSRQGGEVKAISLNCADGELTPCFP